MQIEMRKVSELTPYERNPRRNDGAVDAVAESIRQFGFKVPIVVDRNGVIVAGHTRLKAAKKLRLKEVPVVVADDLTDEQIKAFRLVDNKTAELAEWDFDALKLELDDIVGIDMADFGFLDEQDEDGNYERTQAELRERIERGGDALTEDDEYRAFVDKFKLAKTTDDCYTPQGIYEVVADYVAKHYGVDKKDFVRPFYPGGDYQREKYTARSVVVDNPPFSILSQICRWYNEHKVRYFLFAPYLTCLGLRTAQKVVVNVAITYDNGANVSTAFVTNMDEYEARSDPELYAALKKANDDNLAQMKKELPVYDYPLEVMRQCDFGKFSKYGVEFGIKADECARVSVLDAQREKGAGIYGSGYFISERKAAERAAAERAAAERAAAERAAAERARATVWALSERERKVIKGLT